MNPIINPKLLTSLFKYSMYFFINNWKLFIIQFLLYIGIFLLIFQNINSLITSDVTRNNIYQLLSSYNIENYNIENISDISITILLVINYFASLFFIILYYFNVYYYVNNEKLILSINIIINFIINKIIQSILISIITTIIALTYFLILSEVMVILKNINLNKYLYMFTIVTSIMIYMYSIIYTCINFNNINNIYLNIKKTNIYLKNILFSVNGIISIIMLFFIVEFFILITYFIFISLEIYSLLLLPFIINYALIYMYFVFNYKNYDLKDEREKE